MTIQASPRASPRWSLGKGPVITIIDAAGRGIITPRPVLRWLRETAEKSALPHQLQVGNGGTHRCDAP